MMNKIEATNRIWIHLMFVYLIKCRTVLFVIQVLTGPHGCILSSIVVNVQPHPTFWWRWSWLCQSVTGKLWGHWWLGFASWCPFPSLFVEPTCPPCFSQLTWMLYLISHTWGGWYLSQRQMFSYAYPCMIFVHSLTPLTQSTGAVFVRFFLDPLSHDCILF